MRPCRCTLAATIKVMPLTPVSTIISTENIESRARVGLLSPVSIVEAIRASSITITDPVSTKVPSGSPRRSAS